MSLYEEELSVRQYIENKIAYGYNRVVLEMNAMLLFDRRLEDYEIEILCGNEGAD